jgi:hypothetical protein
MRGSVLFAIGITLLIVVPTVVFVVSALTTMVELGGRLGS